MYKHVCSPPALSRFKKNWDTADAQVFKLAPAIQERNLQPMALKMRGEANLMSIWIFQWLAMHDWNL